MVSAMGDWFPLCCFSCLPLIMEEPFRSSNSTTLRYCGSTASVHTLPYGSSQHGRWEVTVLRPALGVKLSIASSKGDVYDPAEPSVR